MNYLSSSKYYGRAYRSGFNVGQFCCESLRLKKILMYIARSDSSGKIFQRACEKIIFVDWFRRFKAVFVLIFWRMRFRTDE